MIRLSALGDFIQALGPIAAIRRHHVGDLVSLLTTRPLAGFAEELGYFDEVIVDERPSVRAIPGWLRLRRRLRQKHFDRVYDLQTSTRSSTYAWLLRPGMPEWSGIAWRCSHPHANRDRDPQHTLDKQAEQLLMAGIYRRLCPRCRRFAANCRLRWRSGILCCWCRGHRPVIPKNAGPPNASASSRGRSTGGLSYSDCRNRAGSAARGAHSRDLPAALDLTGKSDLALLGALAQRAGLTVGNDTGVCHLAAAAGCAVVVLFSGSTDPGRCAPRGHHVEAIAVADLCELAADAVVSAALEILRGRRVG